MTGRNDPCECGSGKKYKKCCLLANDGLYYTGQKEESNDIVKSCLMVLKPIFGYYNFIDITNLLSEGNYKMFQTQNFFSDTTVMIANRTKKSEGVFASRSDDVDSDIILMHHGAYRTFPHELLPRMVASLRSNFLQKEPSHLT
jgi:hypothetical protein